MSRLILLLAIGLIVWIVYQRVNALQPEKRKAAYIKIGTIALIAVVVLATITGRMHWLGAAITAVLVGAGRLLPTLIKLFPVLQWLKGQQGPTGPSSGQQSQVETSLLRMTLDHASGELRGEVLAGEYQGRQLDELEREQCQDLLAWCRERDADSARLLESYLQKRFGDGFSDTRTPPPTHSANMGRAEALAVLGVEEGADKDDIVTAHRRLMQKLHPDRGGNDYLAAKLNQAKDILLG
jgi:hypothetical protein